MKVDNLFSFIAIIISIISILTSIYLPLYLYRKNNKKEVRKKSAEEDLLTSFLVFKERLEKEEIREELIKFNREITIIKTRLANKEFRDDFDGLQNTINTMINDEINTSFNVREKLDVSIYDILNKLYN